MELNQQQLKQTREISLTSNPKSEVPNTYELAFSSEYPVQREINGSIYNEILLHGLENVDLTRFQNGVGAVLHQHDPERLIGRVLSAHIDADKKGRATIQISETFENRELIESGILHNVSVGYEILEYKLRGEDLLVTKWAPYELSLVSIPADPMVGLNRSMDLPEPVSTQDVQEPEPEDQNVSEQLEPEAFNSDEKVDEQDVTTDSEPDAEELSQEVDAVPESEQVSTESLEQEQPVLSVPETLNKDEEQRQIEINSIAKVFGISSEITELALSRNYSIEQFKSEYCELNNNKTTFKEERQMTLNDIMQAVADGTTSGIGNGRRFKIDVNQLRAATNTTTAAAAVQEDVGSFIEFLTGDTIIGKLNPRIYSGLTGSTVKIPVANVNNTKTFGFVGEDAAGATAQATYAEVDLKARTFTGGIPVSRTLLLSSPNIGQIVSTDIKTTASMAIEQTIFNTIGTDGTAATTTPDYAGITALIAQLIDSGVSRDRISVVGNGANIAQLRNILVGNADKHIVEGNVMLDEFPVYESVRAGDSLLIGDFSYLILGEWNQLELMVDQSTDVAKGGVVMRLFADLDFKVGNPDAFRVVTLQDSAPAVQATKK
ncbi:phage major capsid protein [Salmonella enterica subsp. enterica serovar Gloucester]|nr:phage major capsid protein [Salmonella enterica subsp. enterica serovar Gloucester]